MNESKRKCGRAIIVSNNQLVTMYRERQGRIFYTFPGGGMEENETEEECVKREVLEEFGMIVEPVKKVYIYESDNRIEHFYVCNWISGEFGSGEGEEYMPDRNKGVYIPKLINIADIPSLPLMPPEIATAFYNDYIENGIDLNKEINTYYME